MPPPQPPASSAESVLKIKVRLLEISPMIWRRVLIPESYTLHELHGVMQVAMGWEGLHLFEFIIRAVNYSSPELSGELPDLPLTQFQFRKNTKFIYRYDMGSHWEHEVRIEDRQPIEEKQHYPVCSGGSGVCPPEDCGGVDRYLDCRDEALGFDALEDMVLIADFGSCISGVWVNRNAEKSAPRV